MKTYHWNGERWYERNWSMWHHIRYWFIWIGGWEKANGAGWHFFRRLAHGKWKLRSPAPVALFGHRLTFYGWGWEMRLGKRWLVWSRCEYPHAYLSPDGTPSRATTWLRGVPYEVKTAALEAGDA